MLFVDGIFVWVHGCVAGYKAFGNSGVSPYAAFVGVFCRPIEWTVMAPISICVYLYFRLAMEKHLAFLRKQCILCGKSVKRNVNLILFVHLLNSLFAHKIK